MKIKKNQIANVIIGLLIVVFLLLLFRFYTNNRDIYLNKERECLYEKTILEIVLKTNIKYEDAKLNDISLLDKNNKSFYLSNILDTVPSLFLYVPMEGCDKCVQDIYALIKEYTTLNENSIKIFLLVKSPNFRSFVASQENDNNRIKSFYIQEGWLGLDIEKLDTPFLFLADQDFKAKSFFLIDKNIPDINRYYIEKVFFTFKNQI